MKVLTIVFIGHVRYKARRYWLRFVSNYLRQGTTTVNHLSQINPSPQLNAPSYNFKFCSRRPSKINAPGLIEAPPPPPLNTAPKYYEIEQNQLLQFIQLFA